MEIEGKPLSFFKGKKQVHKLMDRENLSFADAIDELKRRAIDEYAKEFLK